MTTHRIPASARDRARPLSHAAARVLVGVGLALAFAPSFVAAQETDTLRVGQDTLPPMPADTFVLVDSIFEPDDTVTLERDSLADTLSVPRLVPLPLPRPLEPSYANGVWQWNRAELLRSTAVSVADLLERIPGLSRFRAGWVTQPELVVSPAALSGDVEVLLDGYPLDPLTSTTLDLSRIGITDLERVRVERRGGRLCVELTPLEHPTPRGGYETTPDSGSAYTRVEIVTGDFDTDGLSGVFMAPRFLFGPFVAAISRLNSDGLGRTQPGRTTGAWLRWSLMRERWGIHAEYRRAGLRRDDSSPFPGGQTREEMIARARVRPWDPFTAELYAGHSEVDDEFIIDSVSTGLAGTHVGLRTAYDGAWAGTHAAVRLRNGDVGPDLAWELDAELTPLPWLALNGGFDAESWGERSAARWIAGAAVGPVYGARAFVELADGSHGIHWLGRPDGSPVVERSTQRAGVDWSLGGWMLGAAAFMAEGDSVAPPAIPGIGLSGARDLPLYPGFDVQGFEVSARVPLPWDFALEGWYTRTGADGDPRSAFQPVESGRVALAWHDLPLESVQLEVDARIELEYRGDMLAPDLSSGALMAVEGQPSLDFDLNIRVLDIHAWVSWQNILHNLERFDLPDQRLPGQAAYFGVKWELWN
ncbi:MAG TPA: hypothetical protein VF039_07200 [Longimicrobiales bacterium]